MNRSLISEPIKRRLRQEAGFGCCKCGIPIFEYHHIVRDSEKIEDLMILCPICHHEATVGAMLIDEQRTYKSHPNNIMNGYVEGKLKITQKALAISMGTNQFIGDGNFILVDQEELLSISLNDSGMVELSIHLYDSDEKLLVNIECNEWISGDPFPWDIESSFQWIKLRQKLGSIALEIDARKYPIEIRADLWRKGQNFQLGASGILFNGVLQNIGFEDLCFVGLHLNADTSDKKVSVEPDSRYGGGIYVSLSDAQERIRKGLESWEQLKVQKK